MEYKMQDGWDDGRELLQKRLQVLLICQAVNLVLSALGSVTAAAAIAGWISRVVTLGMVVVLAQMAAYHERYRKAAIFYGVFAVGGMASTLFQGTLLSLLLSVCSIVASYQELMAHSEVTADKDPKLSRKWHSLFWWKLGAGLISGFLTSAGVVIGVLMDMDPDAVVSAAALFIALVGVVMGLFHVVYLKQTINLYSE